MILLALVGMESMAGARTRVPLLLWNSAGRLVSANDCEMVPQYSAPQYSSSLRVLAMPSALRPQISSDLTKPLLVHVLSSTQNATQIEILGVSEGQMPAVTQAIVPETSLKPMATTAIEMTAGAPSVDVDGDRFSLAGTIWQPASEGGESLGVFCPSQGEEWFAFDVYTPDQREPVAHVAVSPHERALFRSIRLKDAAETASTRSLTTARKSVRGRPIPGGLGEDAVATGAARIEAARTEPPSRLRVAPAPPASEISAPREILTQGAMGDYVLCGRTSVYNSDLKTKLATSQPGEHVKLVQSFSGSEQVKRLGSNQFVHLQLAQGQGWVNGRDLSSSSTCPASRADASRVAPGDPIAASGSTFPLNHRPLASYRSGGKSFGAARSGRLHAATDLFGYREEPILSVSPGKLIRGPYYFYQGTYAVEVEHAPGYIARYGEVTGRLASGVSTGSRLAPGQQIAFMGTTYGAPSMLHFELYSGSGSGPLTQGNGPYKRRSDLMDPTAQVSQWERTKFGQSY